MVQELRNSERVGQSSLDGNIQNSQLSFRKKPLRGVVGQVEQTRGRIISREGTDGITTYTAIEWVDPLSGDLRFSCNCPGWCVHVKKTGDRWCKHTQELASNPQLDDTPAMQSTVKAVAASADPSAPTVTIEKSTRRLL